jgi:hypothetical protein
MHGTYPKPQVAEESDDCQFDTLDFESDSINDSDSQVKSSSTMEKLRRMTWSARVCSFIQYGGLLFGPSAFVTDILYYGQVGFDNLNYQTAYLGFLLLQPVLNLVCAILFGTYLLNYTEYHQQRNKGAYILALSPLIALLASMKLIGFATLFSNFASGAALGTWILIIITPVFKTFPIILIQGLNNNDMGIWSSPLAVFCYVTDVVSCCKEVFDLVYYLGGDLVFVHRKHIIRYLPRLRASHVYDKGQKLNTFGNLVG